MPMSQNEHGPYKNEKRTVEKVCLKCGKTFLSIGAGNRLCNRQKCVSSRSSGRYPVSTGGAGRRGFSVEGRNG